MSHASVCLKELFLLSSLIMCVLRIYQTEVLNGFENIDRIFFFLVKVDD